MLNVSVSVVSRIVCGILTLAVAGVLVVWTPGQRARRLAWIALIALGLLNVFVPLQRRLAHSNLAHYYIGAKYNCPYNDFYKLVAAGLSKPQLLYRDLEHPDRLYRTDPREQRLYFIGLLAGDGGSLPEDATTAQLQQLCRDRGLLAAEADDILASAFPLHTAEDFRTDLSRTKIDIDDNGFNGSPFYVLLRKLDPSLQRPFGPAVFLVNLAWQLAALFLVIRLAGAVFGWPADTRLFIAALMLASWDFVGWALNGLSFAGWFLPVFVALWGFHRRNDLVAGTAIAWAGAMKLFPFAILLAPLVSGARDLAIPPPPPADGAREATTRPLVRAVRLLAIVVAASAVFAALGALTGRSWVEFLRKIATQFVSSGYIANGAGFSQILLSLGIRRSHALIVPQAMIFGALIWVMWMRRPRDAWEQIPRVTLILLSCMGWLMQTWFNYYALISLLLLPAILRTGRRAGLSLIAALGVSALLPDYDYCYRNNLQLLAMLKVIPHLLIPIVALSAEVRHVRGEEELSPQPLRGLTAWFFRRDRALYLLGTIVTAAAVCLSLYRVHAAGAAFTAGTGILAQGHPEAALPFFERAARLQPKSAMGRFSVGLVQDDLDSLAAAAESYRRAIALDPEFALARNNLAVICLKQGNPADALALLEEAARITPFDEAVHVNMGIALARLGRRPDAEAHLRQALLIAPENIQAKAMLEKMRQGGPTPSSAGGVGD